MSGRFREALALAAICGGAVALRVIGLQYGLPSVYNPDEAAIMARALSFGKGTLDPGNFLYPTFYFYVLFAWVGVYLAFLLVTGRVDSIAALQRLYFTSPAGIYTAGRALGVAAGAATILPLYRLGSIVGGRRLALAAAILLAVAPLHVRDSHYVKHDVPATLLIVLAYVAIVRVWPNPRPGGPSTRDALVAAAACGAAFSTHYYCIFLAVPLTLAVVQAWRPAGARAAARVLALSALASAVVFFALSPFIAVHPLTAWRDVTANRAIVVDRAMAEGAFAPALRYAQMLWDDTIGIPAAALAAGGVAWMAARAPAHAILLLAFPVPFLLFIANTAPASRYLNPVVPFMAVFAAWTIARLASRARKASLVFWVLVAATALPALAASLRAGQFFRQDDTRTLAERFVEERIPPGTTLALQPHSAVFAPTRASLVEALSRQPGGAGHASTKFQLQLSLDPYPAPAYRLIYLGRGLDPDKIYVDYGDLGGEAGLQPLRDLGVAFVLIKRYNAPDPATVPLLDALPREARRIAVFSPYKPDTEPAERARIEPFLHNTDTPIDRALARPGPLLELWELNAPGS